MCVRQTRPWRLIREFHTPWPLRAWTDLEHGLLNVTWLEYQGYPVSLGLGMTRDMQGRLNRDIQVPCTGRASRRWSMEWQMFFCVREWSTPLQSWHGLVCQHKRHSQSFPYWPSDDDAERQNILKSTTSFLPPDIIDSITSTVSRCVQRHAAFLLRKPWKPILIFSVKNLETCSLKYPVEPLIFSTDR